MLMTKEGQYGGWYEDIWTLGSYSKPYQPSRLWIICLGLNHPWASVLSLIKWLRDYKEEVASTYKVSQKKCPHVSNCHNSFKIGTRNESRVSFEILRKSSCWWTLKFFNFDFWGLRKLGLKLVTLYLKAWPNQTFSGTVFLGILRSETPFPLEYLSLFHKRIIADKTNFKNTKYSHGRQGCFNSHHLKINLGLRKCDLVMLLDIGLPFLNPIFLAPKSRNWKISVPISKRTSWGFQNSPYFYF